MSDFQIGILLVGVAAVVCVVAYNRVQERRARRSAEESFGSKHPDALMGEEQGRREPALAPQGEAVSESADASKVSHAVDYPIDIRLSAPQAAALILEGWQGIAQRFGHRAVLLGREPDGLVQHVLPGSVAKFSELSAELQMVTRSGVVSEAELLEFRSAVETLAARLGGSVTAPEMRPSLERARKLSAACEEADVLVVLHVRAGRANVLSRTALDALLAKNAWTASSGNRWTMRNERGEPQISLSVESSAQTAPIERLSLFLDVPRTPDLENAFASMTKRARELEQALAGRIEDDNGNRLDDAALMRIGSKIDAVRAALERHGVMPGSALAARLYR